MKVLYIHQHFNTTKGAGGTRSYEMARALLARGHEVTMVCGAHDGSQINGLKPDSRGVLRGNCNGIEVIQFTITYSNYDSFFKRTISFCKFALRCVRTVFSEDYDLLFASSTPLTASLPGIVMKLSRKRKPFVFEVRDLWPELPKAMGVIKNPLVLWAMSFLEWVSYKCADACIGLAPGIVEGIRKRSPVGCPVFLVPNGCDIDLFDTDVPAANLNGVSSRDFLAVFAGAHGIANGLDIILDAASVLKNRGRADVVLLMIGDGREKPRLMERKRKEGLENCIFLNPVSKSNLIPILSRANAGLMILADCPAFYFGTSPNKFFDYIAMGLPVINNYPGWLADLIEEHKCGCATRPGKPEELADAIEQLANDRELSHLYGRNARKIAVEYFNRQDQAEVWCEVLEATFSGYENRL